MLKKLHTLLSKSSTLDYDNFFIDCFGKEGTPLKITNLNYDKVLEKIKNNPEEWWNSKLVQSARSQFLSQNFGSKDILKNHILNLL